MQPQKLLLALALLASSASPQDSLRDTSRLGVDAKKELDAVASRTLTWLTGTAEQNDYVSVGRLANFFGFVKFRVSSAHSIDRSTAGQETYSLLDADQRARLRQLLDEQRPAHARTVLARLAINDALETMLAGDAFDEQAFLELGAEYSSAEAGLGLVMARCLGEVAVSLQPAQREALTAMRARYLAGGMDRFRLDSNLKAELRDLEGGDKKEFWNLTSRLLTWATGTSADNDFETVGKPSQHFGFVSLRVESGHAVKRGAVAGEVLDLLDGEQRAILEGAVEHEVSVFTHFLERRAVLLRELERALVGARPDPERVETLGREVGLLEARMTWGQAQAMLALRSTLRAEQAEALLAMRQRYVPAQAAAKDGKTPKAAAAGGEQPSEPAVQLARGRALFAQCALCHVAPDGGRSAGPDLAGILDRGIASHADYELYSPAMRAFAEQNGTWTKATLDRYLTSPRREVPGTIMGFDGLDDASDRAALIAFLAAHSGQTARPHTSKASAQEPAPSVPVPPAVTQAATRPNIVFLLSDDQAWDGLSVPMLPDRPESGSSDVRTPNLERLAEAGMRFSAAYAPAPVCSPTRASLQTGRSPAALGWTKAARPYTAADGLNLIPPAVERDLDAEYVTFPERLQAAGYRTAHYGKWHLSGGGPGAHGYDEHDGDTSNRDAAPHKDPNPVDIFGMVGRAIEFLRGSQQAGEPAFLQLSFHALHYPENASAAAIASARARGVGGNEKQILRTALAEDLDRGIGQLLAAIDELGLADDTYVIYMSDNGSGGGGGKRRLLSGGKGGVAEGGIRVPLIVRGPGVGAGSVCHERVVGFDWYPTFLEWAGDAGALPVGVEGGSLARLLATGSGPVKRPRPGLVFHFPHYQDKAGPQTAMIDGDWKLMRFYETGEDMLFDLGADLGEARDVAAQHPEVAARLAAELDVYLEEVGARLPVANPDADLERAAKALGARKKDKPDKPDEPNKRDKRGKRD